MKISFNNRLCRPAGRPETRCKQQGVALITALMVVALSTVVAVSMATRQELDVRRTANLLQADQATAYAMGVETWSRVILERDKIDTKVDHLEEDWATIIPPITVEGGQVSGRIEDLQGRFNLNNLILNNADSKAHVAQFKRLLRVLGLDEDLTQAVLDWMDRNMEVRFPEGGEDEEYLALKTPYRTANRSMVSLTELRLVKGFNADIVAILAPHVAVIDRGTTININTATIPVLRSIADGISQSDAESLVEARAGEGYKSVGDFLLHSALAGRQIDAAGLSLASENFLVHARASIGAVEARLYSTISRKEKGSKVLFRARGTE